MIDFCKYYKNKFKNKKSKKDILDLLEIFKENLDWEKIVTTYRLSECFIKRFLDNMSLGPLVRNQKLSEEFLISIVKKEKKSWSRVDLHVDILRYQNITSKYLRAFNISEFKTSSYHRGASPLYYLKYNEFLNNKAKREILFYLSQFPMRGELKDTFLKLFEQCEISRQDMYYLRSNLKKTNKVYKKINDIIINTPESVWFIKEI